MKGHESFDSHTSIADYWKVREDKTNKYEFNPLTKKFIVDQINNVDDRTLVQEQCLALDFKAIVPELIIKPIIHPFKDRHCYRVTKKDLELLKQWAWVRASVRDSVRDSVWASVRASVRASVGASVWASVWASVGASVGGSVGGYISSFFDVKYKHDFTPCVKLWEKGLVPSYDGKIWRLHGDGGKLLWEGTV